MAKPKEVLLAMEEYEGTSEAFLRESATIIRGELKCSAEESERVLKDLRDRGEIDFRMTPGGERSERKSPFARWHWYVPASRTATGGSPKPGTQI